MENNQEKLKGNNIKSYHLGDPELDACDEFHANHPEVMQRYHDSLSLPTNDRRVIIFGTGGPINGPFQWNRLINDRGDENNFIYSHTRNQKDFKKLIP